MPKIGGISGWIWLLILLGAFLGVPWWQRRSREKAAKAAQAQEQAAFSNPPSGPPVPVYPQDYGLPIVEATDQEGHLTVPLLVSGGGTVVTQAGTHAQLSPGSIYVLPSNPPTEGEST